MDDSKLLALRIGLALVAAAGLAVWYHFLARKRLIQDLPTTKVRGVSLGLNELTGQAAAAPPVISPVGLVECVWWHVTYYVEDTSDGNKRWKKTGDRTGGLKVFDLADETGRIPVHVSGASVRGVESYDGDPPPSREELSGERPRLIDRYVAGRTTATRRRVVEKVVPLDADLYVLGTASLPETGVCPIIGHDPGARDPFIVQVGDETRALYHERVGAVIGVLLAMVAAAATGIAWYDGRAIADGTWTVEQLSWTGPLLALVLLAVAMVGLSGIHVYNGLVKLHQRAQRAWSLIDVQLRRRHDLIPALVKAVDEHRRHERGVQVSIAQLRSGLVDQLPPEPTDDAVAAADEAVWREGVAVRQLLAVAESYPELGAQESFRRFHHELVDTEDRISLARTFYNNSVEALRHRAQAFPGNVIAWVFELTLQAGFHDGWGADRSGSEQQPQVGDLALLRNGHRAGQ